MCGWDVGEWVMRDSANRMNGTFLQCLNFSKHRINTQQRCRH